MLKRKMRKRRRNAEDRHSPGSSRMREAENGSVRPVLLTLRFRGLSFPSVKVL